MMSRELPLVSIISVNFNQAEVTRELLRSLRLITYPNIEIIIVDNGSVDRSIETIPSEFPEVMLINTGKNLGFAGGNNVGIRASKGDLLLLLNNDTEVVPGFLEPLVEVLQTTPNAGMATPKIVYHNRDEIIQYAGSSRISSITGRGVRIGYLEKDQGQYDKVYRTELGHGACLLVSRTVINKIGLMPEIYFLYYEEHDWTETAKENGFTIHYVGTSKIYHKESISTGKNSPLKTYYMSRNRILFARRHSSRLNLFFANLYIALIAAPKNILQYTVSGDQDNRSAYMKGLVWNVAGEEFLKKYQDVKKDYPQRGSLGILFSFFLRLMSYARRLVAARWYLRNCKLGRFVTTNGKPLVISRGEIIIHDRVVIWSIFDRTKLSVRARGRLEIGPHTRINGAHIAVKDSVRIGRNVRIAPYTLIMDSDFHDIQEHSSEGRSAPIIIEDDVWIASRVTILKGVTIGRGSVVSAGAVVTKNVPPYTLVGGVPARVLKELNVNPSA
jgi:GT2 family glycosyltransferase/acetyltransferase-like isoleucine patch superfamily enzyme